MSAAPHSAALLAFPPRPHGVCETLRAALRKHRVPDILADAIAREAAAWPGYDRQSALACALAARMRPAPIEFSYARAILLVGPCGAGKSAVADKIAHAAASLGRAVERRSAENGLAAILAGAGKPDHLAIIDSEGFNPRNMRARAAFASLDAAAGLETIGVISALGDAEEIAETVSSFRRVIVTGVDMARRMGGLVSAVTSGATRVAHITRGPHAGDALEELAPDMLAAWLLSQV